MNKGAPARRRRWRHLLWGVSIAFLAPPGLAADGLWPDEPPIPVEKPAHAPALAGAESLRLEVLLLAASLPATTSGTAALASADGAAATVVLETPAQAEAHNAPKADPEIVSPLPVPKPRTVALASLANDGATSPHSLRVELIAPPSLAASLAAAEASAGSGGPSERSPFAAPPLTTSIAVSVDSNAFRFALPRAGDLMIVPSLEMVGLPSADPNLVRMAAPHDPRLTPTPGLDAVMSLGDVTLDAKVNQPLRAVETKTSPDTRPLADRSNFGVDMKLKF